MATNPYSLIAQEVLGAVSTGFQMWQQADRARQMKHAYEEVTQGLGRISAGAQQAVMKNVAASSPEAYTITQREGAKTSQEKYNTNKLPPTKGRFAQSATDQAANQQMATAGSNLQGWRSAAVDQFLRNTKMNQQLGTAGVMSALTEFPLPAMLNAAANADPWISHLVSQLDSARDAIGSMGGGGGGGGGGMGGMGGMGGGGGGGGGMSAGGSAGMGAGMGMAGGAMG